MTPVFAPADARLPLDLDRLEAGQLVRALIEVEPTYTFKHNLVQQVAYESLLASDRRTLHRDVGETLERVHGEGLRELAEILASHFEHAGDAAKALEYTTLAGEQAMLRFATAEAADLFGKAIDLAGEMAFDETRLLHLVQQRGRALELRGEYTKAMGLYEQVEAIGRDRAALKLQLAGVIGATSLQAVPTPLFDPVKGLANAERAVSLAKTIGDPAGQAKAYWLEMLVRTRIDAKAAVVAGQASLDLARRHGLREQEAFTLNDIQSNFQVLGQPDRALQALEEARPIWRELNNLPMLADNLASTAMLHAILAQYDLGIDRSREALAISEQTGNLWGQSYGRIAIGLAHFARGELGPAIREMTRCVETSVLAGFVYPQIAMRSILAIAYVQVGDLETAADLAQLVRQAELANPFPGQGSGEATLALIAVRKGDLAEAHRLLGEREMAAGAFAEAMLDSPVPLAVALSEYHLAQRDFEGALTVVERLSEAFKRFEWRALQGLLHLTRARALDGLGRTADARGAYQAAYDEMVHQDIDAGLWEAEAGLAAMTKALGALDESARWILAAASHVRAIAAGLAEVGLAERFLAQPHIRAILGHSSGAAPAG